MDSFHECLQEYGEGIEVVQICLEPEESSIKDEELSAIADLSFDELKKKDKVDESLIIEIKDKEKLNGITELKCSKSDESLNDQDDDMTITEDDILITPRELNIRSQSADRKGADVQRCLSTQQSKDLSTSDEMVFAVTPTGLERISFDKYWKEIDESKIEKTKREIRKEFISQPSDETTFYDATTRISVQEENNSLLYIDHEIDGYETCLDDDSTSVKCTEKNGHKINGDREIKDLSKQDKIAVRNKDNDVSAKTINDQNIANTVEEVSCYTRPYVQEHIIKQMQSLRIEPLNVNISTKKYKKRSPTKPSKNERRCVEYYNDQAECLKEIRKKKEEEERRHRDTQKVMDSNIKKRLKQEPSEDSTDAESGYVPGCHKCFLENYAYALTKAYIDEASKCKYCEVIRDMLEPPKKIPERRMSAPAAISLESPGSETEEEEYLLVPPSRDRRKSAGPLKFLVPSRRPSHALPTMTVTVSPDRREGVGSQRWGPARRVTLKRSPGAPLGVSIVGGKVDIISKHDSDDGQEKAIFGIFIKNVVPNSPAGKSGELQTGDRILEVDGVCVRSAQHERAVQLIKAAGNTVTLTVQSLQAWNTDSSDVDGSTPSPTKKRKAPATPAASNASATASAPANASATTNATNATNSAPASASAPPVTGNTPESEVKITVTSDPEQEKATSESTNQQKESSEPEKPKPVYSSSESEDEGEDERHQGGRIYTEAGVEIDRASAGAVRRSREEREADPEEEDEFGYTTNKIKKKYASLGESVVVVRLERAPKWGLGLSLAGHRDRSRMAVFVCGMHPEGSASKASPPINVGDEILEVNGIVLHGRCHLNASAIIKGLMGPVFKFIFLRRKEAVEDVAVKPLTQFPAGIDEDADDRFVNYKNVRDIIIKKGQGGLGIMIIEGRHAEAGRGIFVSDLQEGSAAELAGLNIGDMLLAVNKDSLLECSYDAAAAKLKQTEGIVTLTVSTPNVKENEKAEEIKADAPAEKAEVKPAAPAKAEPPPDPSVAPVNSNQDTVIEINSNNELLGVVLLGGSDTLINGPAAIILDIYKNGAIGKDGRLQVGDQIKDCNGIAITKEMSHDRISMTIKQKAPKLKMTIHRQDPLAYDEVEVELTRKGGRPLGVTCVQPVAAQGVYLGDLLPGSPAEVDGKLQKGDILVAVDGKDMTNADLIAAATAFKLTGNKTTIKVKRFKIR